MNIELRPIVIRKVPEELEKWQFYEVIYRDSKGEALWHGTIWLPQDYKQELERLFSNAINQDS